MPGRSSRTEEVREGLLGDLRSGASPVGEKLPNEQVLAERFGVSRATVREAVGALVESGYLMRRHGSGTFVTAVPTRQHALDATLSYTQMIREAGMQPGLEILSVSSRPSTDDESKALRLDPGEPVRVLERLRTADGRPVVYSVDRVPDDLLNGLPDKDLHAPMFDVLKGLGSPVRSATALLKPVIADKKTATALRVAVRTPLQHIEEVDFSDAGIPVMLSSEWHVPGIFELRVNRRS
jgi:GntR family transcriptional regulator